MKPKVTRDICGTYSGYRKHRRMGEEKCQPCRDAHNVHRRATYNPDKNRQYKKKYESNPEIQDAKKLYGRLYDPTLGRAMTPEEYQAKLDAKEARRLEREEAKERKKLLTKLVKLITKRKEYLERKASIKHGTTYNEACKCLRYFGFLCDKCRPIVAAYGREAREKNIERYRATRRAYVKRTGNRSGRDRARHLGVERAPYTRQDIFDRDGYDCYLCGAPVDLNAPKHMKGKGWELYPHVEHVIPLSKGGADTLDNVKIAHAKCNILKGVKVLSTTAQISLH